MPRYEITSPDGKRFEITAPEGAPPEAIIAYAKAQQQGVTAPSVGERVLKGIRDPIDAGAQMLTRVLPEPVVRAGNSLASLLGIPGGMSESIDADIKTSEADYQTRRAAGGQTGTDWARMGGTFAATLPAAMALPLGGATMAGRAAMGGVSGAGFGAFTPVQNTDDFAAEKLKQMQYGGAFGAAAAPVAGALARVVSPNTNPQVRTLMQEGVTPTPGQILGGAAQRTEEKLTSLPIVGDAIKAGQRRGVQEFNRTMYARAVNPIGGNVPQTVGREAVDDVSQQLSTAYNNLLPKLQFKADPQFAGEVARVQAMAGTLPPAQAQRFEQVLREQVIGKLTPQGNASGTTIKEVEGQLGRLASGYRSSPDPDVRQLGAAIQEMQSSIRNTLVRVNPNHADELSKINEGYSVYARIRDAAASQGSADGVFSPAQFAAAVKKGDKSVGKGNYARGRASQQDVSDAAKSVLGPSYPDSGTAGRGVMAGLTAGGGFMVEPTIPLALGAASAAYLPGARGVLAAMLARRPQAAPALAQYVRDVVPLMGAAGAPAVYQATNK